MFTDESISAIKELVEFVQNIRFDGCETDKDCHGEKICCGAQIGGTCVQPQRKSMPSLQLLFLAF